MNSVQVQRIDFEKEEWADLVGQLRSLRDTKQKLEKDLKVTENRLKELCHGESSVEQDGLKVQLVTAKGTVQWRQLPEVVGLSEQYLDSFRGDDRAFYKFSFYA